MKYRFVKRRPEISAKEINSMKDFDTVLKGSRRLLDIAFKGKLLWTLTIPVAIVVYTLVVNQTPTEEPLQIEQQPVQKEALIDNPNEENSVIEEEKETQSTAATPAETVAKKTPVAVTRIEEKLEQPDPDNETSKELIKEDVYIKASPIEGYDKFYAFIDNELTYPELARKDSIDGHVKVLFSIDRAGAVSNVTIVESLGDLFDNEAIRVIKRIPDWIPATFNGEPVSSRMSIKLTFKIQ